MIGLDGHDMNGSLAKIANDMENLAEHCFDHKRKVLPTDKPVALYLPSPLNNTQLVQASPQRQQANVTTGFGF